jgi:hypothetical protein
MICLGQDANGFVYVIDPQPTDLSGCTLVGGSYSELGSSVWDITAEQGAQIAGSILLLWALAWVFRQVAQFLKTFDEEKHDA